MVVEDTVFNNDIDEDASYGAVSALDPTLPFHAEESAQGCCREEQPASVCHIQDMSLDQMATSYPVTGKGTGQYPWCGRRQGKALRQAFL